MTGDLKRGIDNEKTLLHLITMMVVTRYLAAANTNTVSGSRVWSPNTTTMSAKLFVHFSPEHRLANR